jgi:UDP-glucose 4-epimerase
VIVTGGAGFIGSQIAARLPGSHIIDDLSGGYRRNVPEHSTLHEVTLTDAAAVDRVFDEVRPELVIHCAAYAAEGLSHWMRRYCYTQNLVSWANLANAAVKYGTRKVVVLSSMAVYGSQEPPFSEDMWTRPEDPYGAAKAAMETDVRALGEVQGLDWLIIRPHNVYGPRQNLADPYRNVVAIFMRQALAGKPLSVFGDGQQVRAFSYIDDVAGAIADLATSKASGEIVNVGGEEPIPILTLAKRVIYATGSTAGITHLAPRHEVRDAYCRHDALRRLLGRWEPTDMTVGLRAMAEWARGLEIGPMRSYDYEVTERLYEAWR